MNGVQAQTSAITMAEKASAGVDSQLIPASGGISVPNSAANRPNSGLNRKRHEMPTSAGLMANGRISSVCTARRSSPPRTSSSARPRASTVVKATLSPTNNALLPTESQNSPVPKACCVVGAADERPRHRGARQSPGAEREDQGVDQRPDRRPGHDQHGRQHQQVLDLAVAQVRQAQAAARRRGQHHRLAGCRGGACHGVHQW